MNHSITVQFNVAATASPRSDELRVHYSSIYSAHHELMGASTIPATKYVTREFQQNGVSGLKMAHLTTAISLTILMDLFFVTSSLITPRLAFMIFSLDTIFFNCFNFNFN